MPRNDEPAESPDGESVEYEYAGVATLNDYAQRGSFAEDVEDIIRDVITTLPTDEQMAALAQRLGAYLDDDEDAPFALILACSLGTYRLRETVAVPIDEIAPPGQENPLRDAVRRLQGLFAPQITRLLSGLGMDPKNWADLDTRIYYQPLEEELKLEFEITRFDQSTFSIHGPPASFLRLVNYLLGQLTAMPASAQVFEQELPDFVQAYGSFTSQYSEAELAGDYSAESTGGSTELPKASRSARIGAVDESPDATDDTTSVGDPQPTDFDGEQHTVEDA